MDDQNASTKRQRKRLTVSTQQDPTPTPTPSSAHSGPASMSPLLSRRTTSINGIRIVAVPQPPSSQPAAPREIHCRGLLTLEAAKEYGSHGGSCVFQWPPGLGNPYWVVVCGPCRHSATSRGYF